jgi:hypothetical protein
VLPPWDFSVRYYRHDTQHDLDSLRNTQGTPFRAFTFAFVPLHSPDSPDSPDSLIFSRESETCAPSNGELPLEINQLKSGFSPTFALNSTLL